MKNAAFSEEALKQAAAAVRQSMLNSMPPPSQCGHAFSPAFRAKMERLISQNRLRMNVRKALKRAAMFFLALLVGAGAWLAVDVEARAAFFSWTREIYENNIIYRFFGEPEAESLPAYRLSWLPEGYEEVDVYADSDRFNAFYQYGDDELSGFVFEYFFFHESSLIAIDADETNHIYKTVDVNGIQADFYQALDPDETNNLIWVDEEAGIVFTIDSFLDESVILHMAESITLTDSTK